MLQGDETPDFKKQFNPVTCNEKNEAAMKKVLIAKDLKSLFMKNKSFLDRADIRLFTAQSNDEVINIHGKEKVDLVITQLDMPGIKSEKLFHIIRNSEELRAVSTIIIGKDTLVHRERCKQCSTNAVFTLPVDIALLHIKVQQFLNVAPRKFYRVPLAVAIQGTFRERPLPFWTENISAKGMLIKSQELLLKGDGIFFSFFLPDGTHVSGYGEIARVVEQSTAPDAFYYGIKFTNIDPSEQSAIESAVNRLR